MPLGNGKIDAVEKRVLVWAISAIFALFTGNGTLTEVIHGKEVAGPAGLTAAQIVALVETMVEPANAAPQEAELLELIELLGSPWLQATTDQREKALATLGKSGAYYTRIYTLHSKMFPAGE